MTASESAVRQWSELCDGLRSDKITTRKVHKSAEEIRTVFSTHRARMLSALRVVGTPGPAIQLWNSALQYLRLESAKVEADGKKKGSLASLSTQIGLVRGFVVEVLQRVIQHSPASLSPGSVFRTLTEILVGDWGHFLRDQFAEVAIKVLTYVLPQSDFHRRFLYPVWPRLLNGVFHLFVSTPQCLTLLSTCQFLHNVIFFAHQQTGLVVSCLRDNLDVLTRVLSESHLRQESMDTINAFFHALNLVSRILSLDCRPALCQMGETGVSPVLDMFESRTQKVIVEFLVLQMQLHHPKGADTQEKGALVHDDQEWRTGLYRIYANIIDTSIRNHIRRLNSRFERNYCLEEPLVQLAAMVCHQLFKAAQGDDPYPPAIHVTQITHLDTTQGAPGPKRRRVEGACLHGFLEFIRKCMSEKEAQKKSVAHLQILKAMLEQFSTSFRDDSSWQSIFQLVTESLKSCKLAEARTLLLACGLCLLEMRDTFRKNHALHLSQLWESALTCIATNQCTQASHDVAQIMIKRNMGKNLNNLYELYLRRVIRCNSQSIKTLTILLYHRDVPPSVDLERDCSPGLDLFLWLFDEDADSEESMRYSDWEVVCAKHPELVAHLIWSILLKSKFQAPSQNPKSLGVSLIPALETSLLTLAQREPIIVQRHESQKNYSRDGSKAHQKPNSVLSSDMVAVLTHIQDCFDRIFDLIPQSQGSIDTKNANGSFLKAIHLATVQAHILVCGCLNLAAPSSLLTRIEGRLSEMIKLCLKSLLTILKAKDDKAQKYLPELRGMTFCLSVICDVPAQVLSSWPDDLAQDVIETILPHISEWSQPKSKTDKKGSSFGEDDGEDEHEEEDGEARNTHESFKSSQIQVVTHAYILSIHLSWIMADAARFEQSVQKLLCSMVQYSEGSCSSSNKCHLILIMIQNLATKLTRRPTKMENIIKLVQNCARFALKSSKNKDVSAFDPGVTITLLNAMKSLIGPLAQDLDPNATQRFQMIVKILISVQHKSDFKMYPPAVEIGLVELLLEMAQKQSPLLKGSDLNKTSNQLEIVRFENDIDIPLSCCFFRFISHDLCQVRILSLHGLYHHFKRAGVDIVTKQKDLQLLKGAVDHFMNTHPQSKGTLSLYAPCVLAYGVVALAEEALDREVIVGLITLQILHKIPKSATKLAVKNLGVLKIGQDVTTRRYLTPMLTFIFNEYLKLFQTFKKFPTFLLDCDSVSSMVRDFEEQCVPVYFWRHPNEDQSDMVEELGKPLETLCVNNFPRIAAFMLPSAAPFGETIHSDRKARTKSRLILDKVTSVLGQVKFNDLLNKFIPEILSMVFKSVHDSTALKRKFGCDFVLCQPNPPYTSEDLALNLIPFFDEVANSQGKLFCFLLELLPDTLQRMVHEISVELKDDTVYVHSKIRALHGLHLFLSTIEKENAELLAQMPFVLWFVTDNIQLIVTKYAICKELLILSVAIAEKIIDLSAYFQDPQGQVLWLVPLRNCLCQLLNHPDPLIQQRTLNLFKNMLSTHSIRIELAKMGPFPIDSMEGRDLNRLLLPDEGASFSLSESISHFLEFEEFDKSHRIQSLQTLQLQLRNLREEKDILLGELADSMGFTEDARSSLIHRLMCDLLKILETQNGSESQVRVLVARCLGEIGPVNLHTHSLEPRPEFQTNFLDLFDSYLSVIVKADIPYINNTDTQVSCAAIQVLKALIPTPQERKLTVDNLGHYHKLLEPFRTSQSSQTPFVFQVNVKTFENKMSNDDLWSMSTSFSDWIKDIVISLLSCLTSASTYLALKNLCSLESEFAAVCFPILVHEILRRHFNDRPRYILSERFQVFFHKYAEKGSGSCAESSQSSMSSNHDFIPYRHKSSLMTLINVINHLRNQKLDKNEDKCSWRRHFWLKDLDYLEVAQAALECSAYFSAILFCDVWAQNLRKTDGELHEQSAQYEGESLLNLITEKFPENGVKCKQILFESYKNLGEKDALYGCNDIGSTQGQLQMMVQEQNYFKAIGIMDSNMGTLSISKEFADLMLQSGLFSTLLTHLKLRSSLTNPSMHLENVQYECLWRLEQWGPVEADHKSSEEDPENFRLHHYNALSSLSQELSPRFPMDLTLARQSMIGALRLKNRESSASLYQSLGRLALITELEEFQSLVKQDGMAPIIDTDHLTSKFECKHFSDKEPILLQRCLAIQKLRQPMDRNIEPLVQASMVYLDDTIDEGAFQLSLDRLKKLETILVIGQDDQLRNEVVLKKAKAFWQASERKMAISMMEQLVVKLRGADLKSRNRLQNADEGLLPECLLTLGKWYCSEKSQSPNSVDTVFSEALTYYERSKANHEQRAEAFITMAKFSDDQYQKRLEYTESKDFENKQIQRQRISESVKDLVNIKTARGNADVTKSRVIFDRSAKNDALEESSILKETHRFLESAVINYGQALAISGQSQDTPVYRFISLWFNNAANEKVNKIVESLLNHLPTYKFIPMVYQLAARLSSTKSKFQTLLFEMLVRCVRDHPYHAIPVLLALVNANKDSETPNKSGPNDADKINVSSEVLNKGQSKRDPRGADIGQIITKMNMLCVALIEFAYHPNQSQLPVACKIQKLPDLTRIPILTTTIPVREDRNYKNKFVGIQKQGTNFSNPGGITAPKKISCLGTDGRKYTQLLKGKDDLRQDAVMQQVFSYLNILLKSNRSTRQKRLRMRQYKVVPLSQRSGILEWCENTMPLRDYLSKAHTRYYPKDMKLDTIRNEIKKLCDNRESDANKRARFLELSKAYHPVFRYFFYENFPDPSVHFERRLAFTRSMAAASMIGYILGLGDRHLQNILIDCTTAEIIHIDFGVAFEQGKILPTPEKVPFRLTRDLVDGFGPCGVEGSFKRCCEETLGVLRENKEGILTILEVLIHDPLYQWSLTPERVFRIYGENVQRPGTNGGQSNASTVSKASGERNQMAEMALHRVRQKLNGLEEGNYLSITGQVNGLIQQARDAQNLSLIFHGWGAML
ncbi:hypothetical protein TCAL_12356 [Tigriopus californicus]|uniref:Serine/threonine-protein kinase ATM n=1 Tax=Tigriopus californicus TaxID=6832 RepID=A0A553P0G4_TIGCA|nr:hypothetical protein TCAL_12356 [Tigriopus californicus]